MMHKEALLHHADMRIPLDLNDGLEVSYGNFWDLLAKVKAVSGGAGDE